MMPTHRLVMMCTSSSADLFDSVNKANSASSTTSVSSSILEYRKFQGRTYHNEKYNSEYFAPNDERQRDSMDIS